MGANTAQANAAMSGNREYMEQQQIRQDTQNAFTAAIASFGNALSAAEAAKGGTLSMASGGLQLAQTESNYRDARTQLKGGVYTAAAANGVKVTGSVAESLTQSLTQMGLEEANRKYDIKMQMIDAERNRKMAKAAQAGSLLSAFGNTVAGAVGSYGGGGGSGTQTTTTTQGGKQ